MPVLRSSAAVAPLAVAGLLALTACSDDDAGNGAAPDSSPTSSSPATTTAPPLGPELPDDDNVRRALADYYAAVNRAVANRSVAELDAVSTPDCPCRDRYEQVIDRMNEQDVRASGYLFTGVATGDVALNGESATLAAIDTTEDYEIVDAAGTVVDQVGPDRVVVVYTFTLVDGDWLVSAADAHS